MPDRTTTPVHHLVTALITTALAAFMVVLMASAANAGHVDPGCMHP